MRSPILWIVLGTMTLAGVFVLSRLVLALRRDAEQLARRSRTQGVDLTRRVAHLRADLQITQDRVARLTRPRRPG